MSEVVCPIGITTCLIAAEEFLGEGRNWLPQNDLQKRFLEDISLLQSFQSGEDDLNKISDLIKWIASTDPNEINQFFTDNGFPEIKAGSLNNNEFGVGSILDVLVKWLKKAKRVKSGIESEGKKYDAFDIGSKYASFNTKRGHNHPIVLLKTKNEVTVYLTMLDEPLNGFQLYRFTMEASKNLRWCNDYSGVLIPMVNLEDKIDISWLGGLATYDDNDNRWWVESPAQKVRFKMNEFGARVQVATGMVIAMALHAPKKKLIIDKPFAIWFCSPHVSQPLVSLYIDQQDWEDPGSL